MKATVDQYLCIGCGVCVGLCPQVFCMGADGKSGVYRPVTEETLSPVQEAMDSCPVTAISWLENE
ncbi:MAG TPA: ferredoxin [Candidatus Enterenecus avicola]|nr:ferredoxin [Candidatus Enterenecus avicola]